MDSPAESSQAFSALIKRMSRASLEYVVFEALLKEAVETDSTKPTLERVNHVLKLQEAEASPAAAPPTALTSASTSQPALTSASTSQPAPTSAVPQQTLGKDKTTWSLLTEPEQSAARAVGYNQLGWDEGIPPEACSKRWASLAPDERSAAEVLGYVGADWDAELEQEEQQGAAQPTALASSAPASDASASTSAADVPEAPASEAATATAATPAKAEAESQPDVSVAAPQVTLGKDKATWAELTVQEQTAARTLGYNQLGWEQGIPPKTCSSRWAMLTASQQSAAISLGYTEAGWDEELAEEASLEVVQPPPARLSPVPSSTAAPPAVPPADVPAASSAGAAPAPEQAAGLFGPPAGAESYILGKDKGAWSDLTKQEREAATSLGYGAEGWDSGIAPDACSQPWSGLSKSQQRAALLLGYSASVWDAEYEESMAVEFPIATAGEKERSSPVPPAALASRAPNAMVGGHSAAGKSAKPAPAKPAKPASPTVGAAKDKVGAAKDKVWRELSDKEKAAAATFGYTSVAWDQGDVPEKVCRRWSSLSTFEKRAATTLGYSTAEWDAELQPRPSPKAADATKPAKKNAGPAPPPPPTLAPLTKAKEAITLEQLGSGGAVFGCTHKTKDECMSRQLLGLPGGHKKMIDGIKPFSTAIFLFNYSKREMYGAFEADEPGGMNIVPAAWREHGSWRNGKGGEETSPFPAQVHFRIVYDFPPLPESRFKHIMKYVPNSNRFQFNLTDAQVADLLNAFKIYDAEKKAKR